MPKMEWGAVGQRFFETGIDRGVLYPLLGMGVPWDGLVSVTERAAGGEPKPYYYDGFKYLNLSADQEFEATISAYSAPRQFDKCDGSAAIQNGLLITQQRRESFGFSYRTRIGNDVDGATHGYKIHLVYNALAGPSDREHQSLNDSVSPMTLSWSITTAPPQIVGYRPSAHFVIDSRYTPPALLAEVENILYGTDETDPYLPEQQDLVDLMTSIGPVVRQNDIKIPIAQSLADISESVVNLDKWTSFNSSLNDGWVRSSGGGTGDAISILTPSNKIIPVAGDKLTMSLTFRAHVETIFDYYVMILPVVGGQAQVNTYQILHGTNDAEITKVFNILVPEPSEGVSYSDWNGIQVTLYSDAEATTGIPGSTISDYLEVTEALVEYGWTEGDYFDGNTPDTSTAQYDWLSTPWNSSSTMRSWYGVKPITE